ncbi:MAG: ABC transporter permease [Prochlorococcaceae cyanobacterium]
MLIAAPPQRSARRRPSLPLARLLFSGLGLAVAGLMVLPLVYLLLRASEAEPAQVVALLWRWRTVELLANTAALTVGVLTLSTLIALPLAWLLSRTNLHGRRWLNLLAVLPLAVPGYVMAYALIGLAGNYGFLNQTIGVTIPRPQGLWGATLALSLYCYPYLYLNLRAAFAGLEASLEETARALGASPRQVFRRVTLPHLMPALMAGWLVVGLYVLGDFGAVALMRFRVFSYVIYQQYAIAYDLLYSAWLSLILIAIALLVVWVESRLRQGQHYSGSGTGSGRPLAPLRLPAWGQVLGLLFAIAVATAALGLPVAVLSFWISRGVSQATWQGLLGSFGQSLSVAAPAALLAGLMAIPVAVLAVRFPGRLSRWVNRLSFVGYAVPALAFALAFVFFTLRSAPWLYQTHGLLVLVYALAFLALAIGPIRSALYQARPAIEEAARALGLGPLASFRRATLPLIQPGLVAAVVLVFVTAMKELPIAFLLAPPGFRPLAIQMFSRTSEGMLVEAAPYAAAIIAFSALAVGVVLRRDRERPQTTAMPAAPAPSLSTSPPPRR